MANTPATPTTTSTASSKAPAKKLAKPAATKSTAKPTVKTAKPVTATLAGKVAAPVSDKVKKPAKISEAEKQKAKKPKLVRDSFTIPKDEYQVFDTMKQRSAKLGQAMKKSELLRAGIKLLNSLDDAQFKQAVAAVPAIKTGRPQKSK